MTSTRDSGRKWQTAAGNTMEWGEMGAWHLHNAARFLRTVATQRSGLLPEIAAYVGDDCGDPRTAIRAAKAMNKLAYKKLMATRKRL